MVKKVENIVSKPAWHVVSTATLQNFHQLHSDEKFHHNDNFNIFLCSGVGKWDGRDQYPNS